MGLNERSDRMCIDIKSRIFRILIFILQYHLVAAIVFVILNGQVWAKNMHNGRNDYFNTSFSQFNSAYAAYAKATNTIYLSEAFLARNFKNEASVVQILIEEIGHALDTLLNETDTPGDEGRIFAALVLGETFSNQELRYYRMENDLTTTHMEGQYLQVELAKIEGTPGNDFIDGTDGPDIIYLYGGNDTCSGDRRDNSGYFGDDKIYGGDGNDTIYGEYKDAQWTEFNDESNDYIEGGDGDDLLYGDGCDRYTTCIRGNDTLIGGNGNDMLLGYGNDDHLEGGSGNDYLYGGAFDYAGNNTLLGGPGNDILKSGYGYNTLDGGGGYDIVDYSLIRKDLIVDLSKGTMVYKLLPGIVFDTIVGIEEVRGGQRSDELIGDHNDNKLYGDFKIDPSYYGNDILEGGPGNDTLIGNLGTDTARYSNAPSSVIVDLETNTASGGDGNDTLETIENVIGSAYADVLIGNTVNNGLDGMAGDDLLQGKRGDDTLIGGEDNDTLEAGPGNDYGEGQEGDDILDGGEGDDELYGDSTTPIQGAGNDTLYGRSGNDELYGGEGDDIVDGGLDDDGIYDGAGNDQLFGNSGDDDLRGGEGNDFLHGGEGNDRLYGQRLYEIEGLNDDDIIFGGTGDDTIQGDYSSKYGGNDYLNGGDGNDTIRGGPGRDILVGGRGDDNLDGGYFLPDSDIDTVSEFADVDFTLMDEQLVGLGVDRLASIESAFLRGGRSDNVLDASAFTVGSVTLFGEKGSDTLKGGNGDDVLAGVSPGSFSPGFQEQDTLEGGAGADRFVLGDANWLGYDDNDPTSSGANDYARITDFNSNDDVIQLYGVQSDYVLVESGTDTRLFVDKAGGEPDELIAIIDGVTNLSLNSRAFVYVQPAPAGPEIVILGNDYEIVNGSFSPNSNDHTYFGSAHVSDGTIIRTFTIFNTGSTDLSLTGSILVVLDGVHAVDFEVIEQPSSPILPGESTTFQIQFDPSDLGIRYATVTIANNDSDENPYTFTIQGTGYNEQSIIDSDNDGIPDELEVITCTDPVDADTDDDGISDGDEDSNHDGIVDIGETDPCDVDTDNDGVQDGTELGLTTPIQGTDVDIFIPDQDPASTTDPLNRDTDGDGFTDGQEDRNFNGRIDEGETDPNDNSSFPEREPRIEVTPSLLDFGDVYVGGFSILTVTITNVGYADLTISGVQLTGTTSKDYTITSNPTPITLKPGEDIPVGEKIDVDISYTPEQIDSKSGTLEIFSNDPISSITPVALSGSGIPGKIKVTPGSVNFGTTYVGDTTAATIVITNVDTNNIDIASLEISGTSYANFVILSNPAPFTLMPEENVTVNITYTPNQSEADTARLEIHTTGDTNSIVPVSLSGMGCGGLGASINSDAGYGPAAIAAGDLNKDGILDLAVADETRDSFAVMLGNGDGTFLLSSEYPVGNAPGAIAIADLNHDGNLDVVVADSWSATVSVSLGNGEGEFTSAGSFQAGTRPESIAIGDFNSDAFPDLAVINQFGNGVSILMGNGDGTFGQASSISSGTYCHSIAVGDFNGDNALDLVVSGSSVAIHLGNNDGTFGVPVIFSGGRDSLAIGDLNGDSILDLAMAGPGYIIVQLGNGDGTFTYASGWSYYGAEIIAIGDFNYDNIPDLAVDCEHFPDRYAAVFIGKGDGTFGSGFNFTNSGSGAVSIAVGDFNNDKGLDLVVANKYSNNVSVFLNQCPAPPDDMDHDGLPDELEQSTCTDPMDADTDDDGIPDGVEDADHNGIVNAGEIDPCTIDTDGDGIQDGTELGYVLVDVGPDTDTSIFQPDEDPATTTDPLNPDTDGDGLSDGEEDTNHNGKVDPGETDPGSGANRLPMITNISQDWNGSDNITFTWESESGEDYDISYKNDFSDTFTVVDTVPATGENTSWTDDGSLTGAHPSTVQQRYYKVIHNGIDSQNTVGMFKIAAQEGMNLISLPLVPFSSALKDIFDMQVTGSDNEGNSDRIWIWNGINYEIAWLVDGVGAPYDGQWYTQNGPTSITLGADQGAWLQIRPGHGSVDIYLLGEVSTTKRTISLKEGMNLIGSCYPVSVPLTNTNLWESGLLGADNEGTAGRIWNWLDDRYEFYWLVDGVGASYDGKWFKHNAETNANLEPGKGFWVQIREGQPAFQWIYLKPY